VQGTWGGGGVSHQTTYKEYAQLSDPSRLPSGLWLVRLMTLICIFEFSDWELMHIYVGYRHSRDHMIVGFTTTSAISTYNDWCCEFESRSGRGVQHYVIKFVSDLRQVDGFHRVLRFPSPTHTLPSIIKRYIHRLEEIIKMKWKHSK
jgi:hypothetical protein